MCFYEVVYDICGTEAHHCCPASDPQSPPATAACLFILCSVLLGIFEIQPAGDLLWSSFTVVIRKAWYIRTGWATLLHRLTPWGLFESKICQMPFTYTYWTINFCSRFDFCIYSCIVMQKSTRAGCPNSYIIWWCAKYLTHYCASSKLVFG